MVLRHQRGIHGSGHHLTNAPALDVHFAAKLADASNSVLGVFGILRSGFGSGLGGRSTSLLHCLGPVGGWRVVLCGTLELRSHG
jgi:hypothetical protein